MIAEINFDGLVGPTHNFAGLSHGNIASRKNAANLSNPKEAALQGLEKMQMLAKMGYMQAVLPPHERPHIPTLRKLGFTGSDAEIIASAAGKEPHLLANICSASSMWVANAATISPAADTHDGKTHFIPANLIAMPHRAIEAETTGRILRKIFASEAHFRHHAPLPSITSFGDEGAANHTQFYSNANEAGVELFVYGASVFDTSRPRPHRFPARQTLEASQAIARLHGLSDQKTIFAQQNPNVIDAGVFHNDVIAVGNRNCLFFHEKAFLNKTDLMAQLLNQLPSMKFVEVTDQDVPVEDAITSYLFNTQLLNLDLNAGTMRLIAPIECEMNPRVKKYLDKLITQDTPIKEVTYIDVRQSMKNGGGPACLRLRVALSQKERTAISANVFLTDELYEQLKNWINRHYRDQLSAKDLGDPNLLQESRQALDELSQLLDLGSVYDFQLS